MSTKGNYGEFISSRKKPILDKSYKMEEEMMSKENSKYVHKSKEILDL